MNICAFTVVKQKCTKSLPFLMLRGCLIGIWTQSLFGCSTLFVILSFVVVVYSSRSVTFSQESSIFAQFMMNHLRGLFVFTYYAKLVSYVWRHFYSQEMLGNDGVLIYPTHPVPAPYHNEPLVKPFNFSYTGIFNVLGLPATHCPLGLSSQGLPIGVQVINNRIIIADGTDQWHFDYINRLCF